MIKLQEFDRLYQAIVDHDPDHPDVASLGGIVANGRAAPSWDRLRTEEETTVSNNDVEHGGDPACWAHLTPNHNLPSPLDDAALAELVRNLSDGVIVANADGVIVFWNSGAERIFGWKQHEALGQTLDLIIPERQRAAHWTGYVQTTVTGHTRYGTELLRVPALHRNGQRRSIAFTVTLLGSTDTKILIAAVIRDETQRWAEEQDLRRQARDHNARSADT